MSLVDLLKDEVDILYAASSLLAKAVDAEDVLTAASIYSHEQGAVYGALLYIDNDANGSPMHQEVMAEWSEADREPNLGRRCHVVDQFSWITPTDQPYLIADTETATLPDVTRSRFARSHFRAGVLLPLVVNERYVGLLGFYWTQPQQFNERDQRIYTALQQQAAAVVDALRLLDLNRHRAARAEALLSINTALLQATNEEEILSALATWAAGWGVQQLVLSYPDDEDDQNPPRTHPVAVWREGQLVTNSHDLTRIIPVTRVLNDPQRDWPDSIMFVEDLLTDQRFARHHAFIADHLATRAMVLVSLNSGGRLQGSISMLWFAPHTFSDDERYTLDALTHILPPIVATRRAYLAKEEARCETEILYEASRAINSARSYQAIVDAIALHDLRRMKIVLAVWEYDDAAQPTSAEVVACTPDCGWSVGMRLPMGKLPAVVRMPHEKIVTINDTQDQTWLDPVTAATLEANGARSFAVVPLLLNQRYVAVLYFQSDEPRLYSDREKRLMAGMGDLVLAAIERVRLQAETELARQHAVMIAQSNAALSQAKNEQDILAAVAPIAEQCGVALSVLAYTDHTRRLEIVALRSRDGSSPIPLQFLPITKFSLDDYPVLDLAYIYPDEPLFIEDGTTDLRTSAPSMRQFISAVNWRAVILIPLKSADQWQGILAFVWNEPNRFSLKMRELFTAIGPTAASVVTSRRAFLAEQVARQETEQRARELAALEERTRLARELHDSVSQALYGIGLGARTARTLLTRDPSRLGEPLDYILSLAEAGLTEMRALIFELRPESLEQEGLITVLRKQAASLQARHNIRVQTDFCAEPAFALPIKEALYRIAREALHNTVKHAQATEVDLLLIHEADMYILEVRDNGSGFNPSGAFPGHLGLKSMRERTASLKGTFHIHSAPGHGTRIIVRIPDSLLMRDDNSIA